MDARVCYLLLYPLPDTTVTPSDERILALKNAPYFHPVDITVHSLPDEQTELDGIPVNFRHQVYDGRVHIVECYFRLDDALSMSSVQRRVRLQNLIQEQFLTESVRSKGLYEEYIVAMFQEITGSPDEFIDQFAKDLAGFIRSQKERFGQPEIEEILTSRVRYSAEELTLVDWEGAIIISPYGDFQSDIELLKIGNYQLLRYRILDQNIESSLRAINQNFREGIRPALLPNPARRSLTQVIQHRLELMLEFEHTEQNLLLIGDWYTTKMYHAIHDEFYVDEWKQAVKSKLDNLESIISIIQDNFSISWSSLLDMVEIAGWLILLVGYFVLFFIETNPR